MGLASTFTNSIVREIGRNYGKSISNDLVGDSHYTPVRMVGASSSIARKRGLNIKCLEPISKFINLINHGFIKFRHKFFKNCL